MPSQYLLLFGLSLTNRESETSSLVFVVLEIIPGKAKRVDSLIKLCLEVVVHQVVIRQVLPVGHLNNYLHICPSQTKLQFSFFKEVLGNLKI